MDINTSNEICFDFLLFGNDSANLLSEKSFLNHHFDCKCTVNVTVRFFLEFNILIVS